MGSDLQRDETVGAIAVAILEIAAPGDVDSVREALSHDPTLDRSQAGTSSPLGFGVSESVGLLLAQAVIPFLISLRDNTVETLGTEGSAAFLRWIKGEGSKTSAPVLPLLSQQLYRECKRRRCTKVEAQRAADALLTVFAARPELAKRLID